MLSPKSKKNMLLTILRNPKKFKTKKIENTSDSSKYRFTIDEKEGGFYFVKKNNKAVS